MVDISICAMGLIFICAIALYLCRSACSFGNGPQLYLYHYLRLYLCHYLRLYLCPYLRLYLCHYLRLYLPVVLALVALSQQCSTEDRPGHCCGWGLDMWPCSLNILHPSLCTLHSVLYTLNSTLCTQNWTSWGPDSAKMQDSNCDARQGSRACDMSGYYVAQRKTCQDGMLAKKKTCQDMMEAQWHIRLWWGPSYMSGSD